MTDLQENLFALQDRQYRDFVAKLIPNLSKDSIIGIRAPAMKKFANTFRKSEAAGAFIAVLPHRYFEEYNLHSAVIGGIKDFESAVYEVERLLPYIDNWATCDGLSPIAFKKQPHKLMPYIKKWLCSTHPYTVRFAIGCLMNYFLDDNFSEEYPEMVSKVVSDEYYVNMMIAWYFATALAKQYEVSVRYLEQRRLQKRTHNKAIQKAIESYRVTDEHKAYLKTLRIK